MNSKRFKTSMFVAFFILLTIISAFYAFFVIVQHNSDAEDIRIQQDIYKKNPEFSVFFDQYKSDAEAQGDELSVLMYAIKKKEKDIAKLLIKSGVNIEKENKYGRTALEFALVRSNTELIRILLSMGATADINESNIAGNSYLSLAAENNDVELINLLIDNGAEVDVSGSDNSFSLRVAVESLAKDSVLALISRGADVNFHKKNESNLFFTLLERERSWSVPSYTKEYNLEIEIAEILLKAGTDLSAKFYTDDYYYSLLNWAMKNDRFEIEYLILKYGFDLSSDSDTNANYLIHAILGHSYQMAESLKYYGPNIPIHHPELAILLIEKGGDVHAKLGRSSTLHLALTNDQPDVAKILIKHGVNLDLQDKYGEVALMYAIKKGFFDVVDLLLNKGANINLVANNGETSLSYAIAHQNYDVARRLIDMGAKVNFRIKDNLTPLSYAVFANNFDIAKKLIEKGADVNGSKYYEVLYSLYPEETDLLFYSIIHGYIDISRLLIENGHEVNNIDPLGYTPLTQVIKKGFYNILPLLVENGANVNLRDSNGKCPLSLVDNKYTPHQVSEFLRKHGATCI
ncbi:ankyrin repeat domain-containing protein [Marinomonas sp.]|uniref:ankyrin repeat domain-containing protein n=1 Tax=Marinomonas sp. TaxID=1904862 RepID=UPI003BABA517